MRSLLKQLDDWLLGPVHRLEDVVRSTALLLTVAESHDEPQAKDVAPLTTPLTTEGVDQKPQQP